MLKEQQVQQRAYLDLITQKAKIAANERLIRGEPLLFDPQGRILINVQLTPSEQEQFKNLGHKPTPVTTVSLDVVNDPQLTSLKKAYEDQYHFTARQSEALNAIRGSIIPLQQEFHFHLGLAARTYAHADKQGRFSEAQMAQAHEATMVRVQELITKAVQDALHKATDKKTGAIDDVKLVQALDKARKSISGEAHRILTEEIVRATGVILTKKEAKALDLKHTAEVITATPNDVVHVDHRMGQTLLISGSEVTAHNRGLGEKHLADRQLITIAHDEANQGKPRIQIRTPSLDVKENVTPEVAIADIQAKLNYLSRKYTLSQSLDEGHPTEVKAFTYNLYTAINDRFEGGKNKQSQGAQYILTGAHNFNAAQMDKNPPLFCLVQNISVNGFGDSLGYGRNALRNEATLMAEMSMLYNTVAPDDPQKPLVEAAFDAYKAYLGDKKRPEFFSQSAQGKQAIQYIQQAKESWANVQGRSVEPIDTQRPVAEQTVEAAKLAIKAMMANNLHQSHDYAKLLQSMSVFIEQGSIGGCKSGNERAQAINGRVIVFARAAANQNDPIVKAINALADAKPEEVASRAAELKHQLDATYNLDLHSGPSMISTVDQGAAAKVNAKRGIISLFNRNHAEESTLDYLQQSKAGKMQAHKGLTKEMAKAWEGPEPKGYFDFIREKWGSVLGTIGAIVLFPVALYQHNAYVKNTQNTFVETLQQKQEEYQQRIQLSPQNKVISMLEDSYNKTNEVIAKVDNHLSTTVEHGEQISVQPPPNRPARWSHDGEGNWRKTSQATLPGEDSKATISRSASVKEHTGNYKEVLDTIKRAGQKNMADSHEDQLEVTPTRQMH